MLVEKLEMGVSKSGKILYFGKSLETVKNTINNQKLP